jgi:hypothetical protein
LALAYERATDWKSAFKLYKIVSDNGPSSHDANDYGVACYKTGNIFSNHYACYLPDVLGLSVLPGSKIALCYLWGMNAVRQDPKRGLELLRQAVSSIRLISSSSASSFSMVGIKVHAGTTITTETVQVPPAGLAPALELLYALESVADPLQLGGNPAAKRVQSPVDHKKHHYQALAAGFVGPIDVRHILPLPLSTLNDPLANNYNHYYGYGQTMETRKQHRKYQRAVRHEAERLALLHNDVAAIATFCIPQGPDNGIYGGGHGEDEDAHRSDPLSEDEAEIEEEKKDPLEAIRRRAIDSGGEWSEHNSRHLRRVRRKRRAVQWLHRLAHMGHIPSQLDLCSHYQNGIDLLESSKEMWPLSRRAVVTALQWRFRAAQQGCAKAMFAIGEGFTGTDMELRQNQVIALEMLNNYDNKIIIKGGDTIIDDTKTSTTTSSSTSSTSISPTVKLTPLPSNWSSIAKEQAMIWFRLAREAGYQSSKIDTMASAPKK